MIDLICSGHKILFVCVDSSNFVIDERVNNIEKTKMNNQYTNYRNI